MVEITAHDVKTNLQALDFMLAKAQELTRAMIRPQGMLGMVAEFERNFAFAFDVANPLVTPGRHYYLYVRGRRG